MLFEKHGLYMLIMLYGCVDVTNKVPDRRIFYCVLFL
jgi:hypothetical protein